MKHALFAITGFALMGAALAETPVCVDAHRSYVARALNNHDVFVQQSIGKTKPPVRVQTSCIDVHAALGFGFDSQFNCLGLGDTVVVSINGGQRETCRVTKVLPYAPQEGDIPQH